MRPRVYFQVALAVALAVTISGCERAREQSPATGDSESQEASEVVRISGSSACEPLLRLLTDTSDADGVRWQYMPSPGSRSGIEGVQAGDLEIGAVSRELTPAEAASGLVYTRLSDDAIVFALHPSVGITELTSQQILDVYGGRYVNWQELGGPDLPIVLLDRNDDEPAKRVMREYVFGDQPTSPRAASLHTETDMVAGVESTVGAIGYFSLGYGTSRDIKVTYPALDGVQPSVQTVRDGSYPITRPLGIVTAPDPNDTVSSFLEWATSKTAEGIIEDNGYAAVR